jgi:hypothetical protein
VELYILYSNNHRRHRRRRHHHHGKDLLTWVLFRFRLILYVVIKGSNVDFSLILAIGCPTSSSMYPYGLVDLRPLVCPCPDEHIDYKIEKNG